MWMLYHMLMVFMGVVVHVVDVVSHADGVHGCCRPCCGCCITC